jgi:hypothetical protein
VDTGFPAADSRDDFARARRNATLARLGARLRGAGDVNVLLSFDEVVSALGRRGETSLGLRTVDLDDIVGSVDRSTGFDRRFRPTSDLARMRFERLAAAVRRGESLPPVDLMKVDAVTSSRTATTGSRCCGRWAWRSCRRASRWCTPRCPPARRSAPPTCR